LMTARMSSGVAKTMTILVGSTDPVPPTRRKIPADALDFPLTEQSSLIRAGIRTLVIGGCAALRSYVICSGL
jgi:hypothetical protein